jgi:hypothetical protein
MKKAEQLQERAGILKLIFPIIEKEGSQESLEGV